MIIEDTKCRISEVYFKDNIKILFENYEPKIIWFQSKFTSSKGSISLIHLGFTSYHEKYNWELYCIQGNLFEDVERYDSLIDAIHRIEKLLN